MTNYYNEIDLYAAKWLENLITAGHIAPGVVDTRSIEDVRPSDLVGFKQCHFFAGIGVWSYALRAAGWPDDRPVWTGSCPCQPFSSAGQGAAFADERHLWPAFHHLIKERKPERVLGEQVASKDADAWIDLVQDDMEAMGYAFGAVPFPSASVGAPHIRDRLYWAGILGPVGLADSHDTRLERRRGMRQRAVELPAWPSGVAGGVAYACGPGPQEQRWGGQEPARLAAANSTSGLADSASCRRQQERENDGGGAGGSGAQGDAAGLVRSGDDVWLGHPDSTRWESRKQAAASAGYGMSVIANGDVRRLGHADVSQQDGGWTPGREQPLCDEDRTTREGDGAGPVNGFWRDADWIGCRDGLWRPVEAWTFPLADGVANRMGKLRAFGNAINAQQARIFIETVMECQP